MGAALTLVRALADPASTAGADWTALIATARAEQLAATLAARTAGVPKPAAAQRILDAAFASAEVGRTQALWEAEMARRALAPLGLPVVLLKGTAYVAAGLAAGVGRSIGDCDILVPRAALDDAEAALLAAGWEWVKPDPYDHHYYRTWMHELPPLIHRERDRMIDVHHTVLPPTARITPDAAAMIADAVPLGNGLSVLSGDDMICHSAAHLFADGDLAGGLRNLWDLHLLFEEVATPGLMERARRHGLEREVGRAYRLASALYQTSVRTELVEALLFSSIEERKDRALRRSSGQASTSSARTGWGDRMHLRRLLARDGWGSATRPATRFAFYVRSHWLRMPPALLARHLWIKWRKGAQASG